VSSVGKWNCYIRRISPKGGKKIGQSMAREREKMDFCPGQWDWEQENALIMAPRKEGRVKRKYMPCP
jgi:hypothetical protein